MNTAQSFSIIEMIRFGWNRFKQRPWLFVGAGLTLIAISAVSSYLVGLAQNPAVALALSVGDIAVQILVSIGIISFMLKAHDNIADAGLSDLWAPEHFWRFLGAVILTSLIIIAGFILIIIPGFIAMTMLYFAQYHIVDKDLGPVAAIKESVRMTRGRRWNIFFFILVLVLLNVLGMLAFVVGMLITIPVSMLATVHLYRMLDREDLPVAQESAAPVAA
jgi:uncharacterized membrane protein